MSLLRAENLSKVFGQHPERALEYIEKRMGRKEVREKTGQTLGVADVSFEVRRGEILVIMGLSGSGKSTLVRCLNRLIEPTAGKVFIDDEDVTAMNNRQLIELRREKIGMVFQRFALFPNRSVLENAEYGLEVRNVPADERRRKAMEALELVGLSGWEHQHTEALSGGMQQRVGLARAIAVDPEIILMDEALSALDPLIRKDMQNEIIDLQRKLDKTICFITHDLDEAINIGDRIILMKDGYIVQQGTAEEILTNPASDYVARFVEDVDMTRIMTAQTIMKPTHDVAHAKDGPRVVLRKMKDAGLSSIFVVDSHGILKGFARAEKAAELSKDSEAGPEQLLEEDVRKVALDTPIQEILPLMTERRDPVAVVDENDRLKGAVVIGALLAGMVEGVSQ